MAKHLRIITEDKRLEGVKKSKVEDGQVYGGADASVQSNDPETVKLVKKHKVEKHEDRAGNGPDVYSGGKQKHALSDKRNAKMKPDEKVYEEAECVHTEAGKACPVHGEEACPTAGDKEPRHKGKKLLTDKKMKEDVELDEVLTKKTSAGKVISDFVHSKDPKFAGKSKKERQKMALGAYYGMHPEKSKNEAVVEPLLGEGGKEKKKKTQKESGPDGAVRPSGDVPNTTQNVKADTGYNV